MNYKLFWNITALKQCYFKKKTEKIWAIKNIKVYYSKIIADLIFQKKFNILVYGM